MFQKESDEREACQEPDLSDAAATGVAALETREHFLSCFFLMTPILGIVSRAVAFRGYLNSEPRGGRYR